MEIISSYFQREEFSWSMESLLRSHSFDYQFCKINVTYANEKELKKLSIVPPIG